MEHACKPVNYYEVINKIIVDNPEKITELKANPSQIGWLVGQVMKATGGKADPGVAKDKIENILQFIDITPGWWYVKYFSRDDYFIVNVMIIPVGCMDAGEKVVWMVDDEGYQEIEVFDTSQFIKPVPSPYE